MSSLSVCIPIDKIDKRNKLIRRSESVTRPAGNPASVHRELSASYTNDEVKCDIECVTSTNYRNILFVYLDVSSPPNPTTIPSLRAINNDVQTFTDSSSCLEFLRSSNDQIFFISSSIDRQLIEDLQDIKSVEAMFIFDSTVPVDSRLPKLYGAYVHFEELVLALKMTLLWFEQTQMEQFVFENDPIFLWTQIWKEEELLRLLKSKALSSNKDKLVQLAEHHYRGNSKMNPSLKEFNQNYVKDGALQWCFSSPFPSTFLHRALQSHNTEHLQACRFLLTDVCCMMQVASKKSSCELYKGMKMSGELFDTLENHLGKLICAKGFLRCMQSRKTALEIASSPDHRPDLMPVLFKITSDASVSVAELHQKEAPSFMVFDVYTVFRVKYVSRGPVSIIKIETADEGGRKLAREYRMKHKKESLQTLLDQLLSPPKSPAKLPPRQPVSNTASLSNISEEDEETQARNLVGRGEIDQAIVVYQRLKPETVRVLSIIGTLYLENKGDCDSAIKYYEKALEMQEKNGDDVTNALSQLGNAHQNRRDFALALSYHTRALDKRRMTSPIDQIAVASSLIGVANAYWGEKKLTKALDHAQQALTLNESIEHGNDSNIAANLAILANIYHSIGDTNKALALVTRALPLLERCSPSNSLALATLMNNVAAIQVAEGLFTDARHSFDRASEILKKTLPEDHPKRVRIENNIQRITEVERMNEKKPH